jgi:hypothetical protein
MSIPSALRVFISYARKDGEAFATQLRQRLECEEPEIALWQDREALLSYLSGNKHQWPAYERI